MKGVYSVNIETKNRSEIPVILAYINELITELPNITYTIEHHNNISINYFDGSYNKKYYKDKLASKHTKKRGGNRKKKIDANEIIDVIKNADKITTEALKQYDLELGE